MMKYPVAFQAFNEVQQISSGYVKINNLFQRLSETSLGLTGQDEPVPPPEVTANQSNGQNGFMVPSTPNPRHVH